MKYCILIFLIPLLIGCQLSLAPSLIDRKQARKARKCNRKLARVIEKCPQLVGSDTIFQQDTVLIPEVRFDTITELSTDTVEIRKDHLSIRYVTVNDSIWIEGQCDTIEVVKEVPVYVTKIEQVDVPAPYIPWWWYVIGGLVLVCLLAFLIIRFILGGLGR